MESSIHSAAPSIETAPSKAEEMLLSEQSSVSAPASAPEEKAEIVNASDSVSNNTRSATIPLTLLAVEALSVLSGLLFMRRR